MEKINKTMYEALRLIRQPYDPNNAPYGEYSSVYLAPTGNVKDMMANFKKAKRVLTVGGIGAFGLEASINDAEKVDMFDCNELQRHFFELVRACITILSYEEFIEYFTLKAKTPNVTIQDMRSLLSPVLFRKVYSSLPLDTFTLFDFLYDNFSNIDITTSALCRFEHAMYKEYLTRFASMYDEEKYYKLQNILRQKSCEITYRQTSLIDVPNKFDGPYDLIVLGNIPQYYQNIRGLDTPYEFNKFIRKNLAKLLAPDGTIAVNYCFQHSTVCLKKKLGKPYLKTKESSGYIAERGLKDMMKTDINVALIGKDGYDYHIFEGVETFDGEATENACLTFKPTKNSI